MTERIEQIMGRGNGGSIPVYIGTTNAYKEGITWIVEKYSNLRKTKQTRFGQIILSGIVPVLGIRSQGYRNSKRMAVGMVQRLCKGEEVGFTDLWDSFVGKEEMYREMGCILLGKGQPFLQRDCQGRLPVAWVKYVI